MFTTFQITLLSYIQGSTQLTRMRNRKSQTQRRNNQSINQGFEKFIDKFDATAVQLPTKSQDSINGKYIYITHIQRKKMKAKKQTHRVWQKW